MFKSIINACVLVGVLSLSSGFADETYVEAKAAFFQPSDHRFKKIYSGSGIYGVEATTLLCRNAYLWASVDCFTKSGRSIGGNDSTHLTMVPVGLGLKYFMPTCFANFYTGIGILGTWLKIHDKSPFVIHHLQKGGIGGIAKVGALINLYDDFFLDLFTNYSYTEINFHDTHHGQVTRRRANLSGWSFGAGLVWRFGCP